MKKNVLLLFLLVASTNVFGQIDFNKIIPKTPEAAALIEKVDNPVNEYTGIPSIGIPIYTVQEGTISLPISLSYNAGGIKVSEEASTVGLGWTLNAGGSITRSLGGIDDFIAYFDGNNIMPDLPINFGFFNPDSDGIVENDGSCNFIVNNSVTQISIPSHSDYTYDNQPDTYHYNFNGYSGSYVLDRNGIASLSKKEGLRITLNSYNANSSTWTIVAEDGTTYKFEKRQQTRVPSVPGNRGDYFSSWFLTQIVGINGEIIDLIYEQKESLEPLKSFTQSYISNLHLVWGSAQHGQHAYLNNQGPTTAIEGVYLSEIRFSNGKVKFNYSPNGDRKDMKGSYSLNSIQVFSTINNIYKEIKNFDFDYSYFGNTTNQIKFIEEGDYSSTVSPSYDQSINARLKLNAVTENSIKTHSFEYNDSPVDIPNKTSFAQDYWGYHNGQRNENYFIPATPEIPHHGDRSPRENFAKTFSLKKITYPTKGFTEYDYELNTYRVTSTYNAPPVATVPKNIILTNLDTDTLLDKELQFTTGDVAPNTVAYYEIHLTVRGFNHNKISEIPTSYGGTLDIHGEIEGDYILTTGTSNPEFTYTKYSPNGAFPSRKNDIILKPNTTYTLKARFNKLNKALYGQVKIKINWLEINDATSGKDFATGGGLRVKEIKNFDNNNALISKRTYNYHYTHIVNGQPVEKSYGKLKTIPDYSVDEIVGMKVVSTISGQGFSVPMPAYMYFHEPVPTTLGSAGSSNSFSTDHGSYVGYDQVSVSDEDFVGNKNGKTIFKFYNTEDLFRVNTYIQDFDDYTTYPPIRVPTNGMLYEKQTYKNDGASFKLINKVENKYLVNNKNAATFSLLELYKNPNYIVAASKEIHKLFDIKRCIDFRFQFYPHYSNKIQQTSSKETVYDLNGNNPIVSEQHFYYDNDTHLQRTRIETTDSDQNTLETKIYYPDDLDDRYDLAEGGELTTTEYFQIDKLKSDDLHRIATPIQTVTKRDGEILSVQRNLFIPKDGIVLPSITEASKGTDSLEQRLLYKDYENGKPIHISKKDGPEISYIWGYNNQYPIAKIENLPYSSIPTSTINDLKAKSNTDNDRTIGTVGNEGALRSVLNSLRNSFPQALITTFTYDPIIGVTSITDPKGYTAYYDYDELQRLKFVKDQEGNLISENKYHYKD